MREKEQEKEVIDIFIRPVDGGEDKEIEYRRPNKTEYYLNIAAGVASRSTCLRRQYGAVIVKNDRIVSTGYNGAARGCPNCCDTGQCYREANGIPHGEQYEKCQAVHAEANAIIAASKEEMDGAVLYLAGFEHGVRLNKPEPCEMCHRLILNSGIQMTICNDKDFIMYDQRKDDNHVRIDGCVPKLTEDLRPGQGKAPSSLSRMW